MRLSDEKMSEHLLGPQKSPYLDEELVKRVHCSKNSVF